MIPRTKTLRVEDFPDQSDWIEPIIRALNDGSQQTSASLSKSLTFGENFNATVQTVELTLKTDWQTPSFSNSWAALGGQQAPQYRRSGDRVEIRGAMASGTIGATAFTLPTGYRPPSDLRFATTSNGAFGDFTITSDGVVTPTTGNNASFWIGCSFGVDSAMVPNGAMPIKFAHKLANGAKPAGCWIVAASDLTDGARSSMSASGYCAWRPNGTEIIIDNVTGLIAGRKYSITFLVTGG